MRQQSAVERTDIVRTSTWVSSTLGPVVTGRAHPVDLLLQSTPDLCLGGDGEHTVVGAERNGTL
jgi:hypothetical protein